jgi:hypothetical protein
MRPRRRVIMGKTTVLVIDPPSGYLYGFPKPAPQNWGFWEWEDKKKWYIEQGYPKEEIESYGNSFYVSMFHMEVEDNYLEGKANLL